MSIHNKKLAHITQQEHEDAKWQWAMARRIQTRDKEVDDLCSIPDFLRRDLHPVASTPVREQKRRWVMPNLNRKPIRKKKPKPGPCDSDRFILRNLGWTDEILNRMNRRDLSNLCLKPRRMFPADEVRIKRDA